jgi:hypothetical protein
MLNTIIRYNVVDCDVPQDLISVNDVNYILINVLEVIFVD